MMINPYPDQEGNELQRPNSNFCKPLKNNSEGCPFNQVSNAAMTSPSDENWQTFNFFFRRIELRAYQDPCIGYIIGFYQKPHDHTYIKYLQNECLHSTQQFASPPRDSDLNYVMDTKQYYDDCMHCFCKYLTYT